MHLPQFIDKKFYELTGTQKKSSHHLIRSERICRLDQRRWGAKFEANTQRPYCESHEREDVVKHRNEFINYVFSTTSRYLL